MKQLLTAILSTWVTNAAAAIVSPPSSAGPLFGINGPFWDAAPEKTPWPYCILSQTNSLKDMNGLGGGLYEEFVNIKFQVFASDATNGGLLDAAGYSDAIDGVYNKNRLTLSTEKCKMARRIGSAMMKKEINYTMGGVAVYSGTLTYEYAVERGSG